MESSNHDPAPPLPGEEPPAGSPPETRIARGIVDGDEVPAEGFTALKLLAPDGNAPLKLDLGLMEMGFDARHGPSWLARMLALRNRLGIFPLAYLETLLRAADGRGRGAEDGGSRMEGGKTKLET